MTDSHSNVKDITENALNDTYSDNGLTFTQEKSAESYLQRNGFKKAAERYYKNSAGKEARIYPLFKHVIYSDGEKSKRENGFLVSFGGTPISGMNCTLSDQSKSKF